jgi:PncC family amidohydrolase
VEELLEHIVGHKLRRQNLKLVISESCTGGLIGHRITNIPGSSDYYLGSITAYAYEAKVRLLGVTPDTLAKFGAVSRQTVIEMAHGARLALAGDFPLDRLVGIAVSGIAGPGGATPEKPVGLVWFGLSTPQDDHAWKRIWKGNRLEVKDQTAEEALRLLNQYLDSRLPEDDED